MQVLHDDLFYSFSRGLSGEYPLKEVMDPWLFTLFKLPFTDIKYENCSIE